MALRHARDNRDFYGSRYPSRELVWEVGAAYQTEDYYEVKLSYRSAVGFRGRPGVEQFTIDKAGPIEFRQILSQPRPFRVLILSIAVLLVLVVGATAIDALLPSAGFGGSGGDSGPIAIAVPPAGAPIPAAGTPTPAANPVSAPLPAADPSALETAALAPATPTPIPARSPTVSPAPSAVELPPSGMFSTTGSMVAKRYQHRGVNVPDGKVSWWAELT